MAEKKEPTIAIKGARDLNIKVVSASHTVVNEKEETLYEKKRGR